MPASAPRYDPRLVRALRTLDDGRLPIAETCRRVGALADELGLPRPSYVHVRRLVNAERERRREVDGLVASLVADAWSGRAPRIYSAHARLREAELAARVRRASS